jgi:hypothetical protein
MGLLLFLILAAAFLLLLAAAFQLPTRRVNLGWLGLAVWVLAILIVGLAGESSLGGFKP